MKGRASRFWVLGIVVVIVIVGGLVFHQLRNRPFAVMGYYVYGTNGLQDVGTYFDKNGMLEVEFHYKTPAGKPNVIYTDHLTYTVLKDGSSQPLLKNASFTTTKGPRPSTQEWSGGGFPIAHYPNDLKLSPGRYHVYLYDNGVQIDSATFYVDKPMVAYADVKQR